MLEKFCCFLSGLKMTLVSLFFLILSIITKVFHIASPVDFACFTIIISGIPIIYWGLKMFFVKHKITASFLITIAMFAAILTNETFAAAEVAIIMAIGGILEDLTIDKAKKGIKRLINLVPKNARKIVNSKEEIILAKEVKNGDVIRVLAGEDIPIDGIIIQGETSINQAVMTGESIPVDKKEGDSVYSGTTNCFGVIEIKANKDYSDSSIQKLVNLVKEAQNNKAPTERIVDKYARVIIPLAIVFAFLVYIVTGEVSRAVTVLVVFCPCSLFLATPTSIVASIAHAAKNNIIVKTGEALEIVGKCDVFAFDKTGTLTEGKLSVSEIEEIANENKDEILRLIASSELKSEHPIGRCIVEYAKVNNINIQSPEDFKMSAGRGIYAKVEGKKIHAGNEKFMEDNGIELSSEIKKKINSKRLEGKIALIVSVNSVVSAIITLSDTIRKSATGAIEELNNLSKTLLLTGDNSFTAEYFAKKIGIQSFQSNMLPKEKASYIEKLQKEGKSVCMTGDGINDAVALKVADVGISMGTFGSDMAIESSDIIITGDNLQKISYLRKLSKICIKTIKVNIIFAMSVNVISLTLSALGMLVPATGAIVHNIISILVVLNAALIYDKKIV